MLRLKNNLFQYQQVFIIFIKYNIFIKQMRVLHTIILLAAILMKICSLSVHSQSRQTEDDKHAVVGLIAVIQGAIGIAQATNALFKGTCSSVDSKKINWISIRNQLSSQLRFGGIYMDQGEIFKNGEPVIANNKTVRWIFAQKPLPLGTAGSKGIIVYRIRDGSNNSLVIYFNNPTGSKSWNSYGVCIMPQKYQDTQTPLDQDTLKKQYEEILSQLAEPPPNCLLQDNDKNKVIPLYQKNNETIMSYGKKYSIGLVGRYEKKDQVILSCYRQQVVVVIRSV